MKFLASGPPIQPGTLVKIEKPKTINLLTPSNRGHEIQSRQALLYRRTLIMVQFACRLNAEVGAAMKNTLYYDDNLSYLREREPETVDLV
jgi:hypothetical protein